jgi:uncharacterized protein (DUF362 family)/ferredoxin
MTRSQASPVSLARCTSYDQHEVISSVQRAVLDTGRFPGSIERGSRVLVKPNLLQGLPPERAVSTHPEVVRALILLLRQMDCEVTIADSPGAGIRYTSSNLKRVYRETGYDSIAKDTGAVLNYDISYRMIPCPEGRLVRKFPVISPVLHADHVIGVSKLKTHVWTLFTGAAKNLFGVVPGLHKPVFHARYKDPHHFGSMIVDLNELIVPALHVMDGVVGMEGDGPASGIPRNMGMILACTNPFSLDAVACRMIGIAPLDVPTTREAVARGILGESLEAIELHGDRIGPLPLARFKYPSTYLGPEKGMRKNLFFRALHRLGSIYAIYPSFDPSLCQSCRRCSLICPVHALSFEHGYPSLNKKACIRCYCCHEICPSRAISLGKNVDRKISRKTGETR